MVALGHSIKDIVREKQQEYVKEKADKSGISRSTGVLDRFKKTESWQYKEMEILFNGC